MRKKTLQEEEGCKKEKKDQTHQHEQQQKGPVSNHKQTRTTV
jgi:hypothetical protein